MARPTAIGFDLGDTLCEYTGIPLNWEHEYPAALALVAQACPCELTPERVQSGKGVLTDVPYGMPRALVVADVAQAGLPILGERLLTSTMVGHRKPHPAGFRALAERIGVSCSELVYVGNERKDVDGGRAVGCRTVLLWRAAGEAPGWGQEFTIRSLEELLEPRYRFT